MTGKQVDNLCRAWIEQNNGFELARRYTGYSLVMPGWNDDELTEALENLRQVLCIAFGPDESFETTDYYEARAKLKLPERQSQIPQAYFEVISQIV